MVISKAHNFCFIHNPRTGGTSMRSLLSKYQDMKLGLQPNAPVRKIQAKLEEDFYQEVFKFAFVRNPWDRLVSLYFYAKSNRKHFQYRILQSMSFKEFIIWKTEAPFLQIEFLRNREGQLDCQFIGRFETLNQDFKKVLNKIDVPERSLSLNNKSTHRPFKEYFTKKLYDRVKKAYRQDILTFGY